MPTSSWEECFAIHSIVMGFGIDPNTIIIAQIVAAIEVIKPTGQPLRIFYRNRKM